MPWIKGACQKEAFSLLSFSQVFSVLLEASAWLAKNRWQFINHRIAQITPFYIGGVQLRLSNPRLISQTMQKQDCIYILQND